MHIVFIAPRYHTNQHYWVKALRDAGHTVSFWVRKRAGAEEHALCTPRVVEPEDDGAPAGAGVGRTGGSRALSGVRSADARGGQAGPGKRRRSKRRRRWSSDAFRALLADEKPNAVVIRNPAEPFSRAAFAPVRESGARVVLYSQGPLFRREPLLRRLASARLQRRMGGAPWITPVRGDRRPPAEHEPANRYFVPFVMEPDRQAEAAIDERPFCPGGVRRVLMVAKYMPRKNHLLLVRALHALAGRFEISLELVGGGGRSEYERAREEVAAYVREHRLDWVTLRPPMPYARLQEHMRGFDLFVLPSRNEAVGVSLLEAMGKGLPVVCSSTTGARDYVEDRGNGRIFESDSLDDLRLTLEELLAGPERLREMGRRSLELVRTVHSPEAFLRRFLPLIEG